VVEESGLSNAWVPTHNQDLATAATDRRQQVVQMAAFGLPPKEVRHKQPSNIGATTDVCRLTNTAIDKCTEIGR
jgi:hypothetical protein